MVGGGQKSWIYHLIKYNSPNRILFGSILFSLTGTAPFTIFFIFSPTIWWPAKCFEQILLRSLGIQPGLSITASHSRGTGLGIVKNEMFKSVEFDKQFLTEHQVIPPHSVQYNCKQTDNAAQSYIRSAVELKGVHIKLAPLLLSICTLNVKR